MRNSLNGKVALITGASKGIGLAAAHELAAQGVRLFITGRRGPEIANAARAIGRGTVGVQADVSNLTDLDRLYEQISRDAGRLDVVFANAGGGDMLPLEAITVEHVDRIFGTNVKGLLFTIQKALPLMKEGGSVILTGSTAGRKGTASFSVYSAAKAAVRNLARSWVLELAPRRIRVNVVSPGPIATPGLAELAPPDRESMLFEKLASAVPMGRLGEAAEVAKAVAFLASEDASFINGAELFVDGGLAQV
jgi:NAD(P)-dependent dehydrogenase (short-subunit alcohol dehydrogenase family)